ncbi:LysE family translocator [Roseibium sp.]|uniref:LysE family translocator n=1 Tax=Roseibium sp. TaxID=1936156 RepID=UPI003B512543
MNFETWLAFVAASLLLTMTPGPSIILGMVHSLHFGIGKTFFTALGDISANMVQMLVVAAGLGVVLAQSALAFSVIKWTGVAVLLFMGWRQWRAPASLQARTGTSIRDGRRHLFLSGFLVAISNPKALVFFTALFPQFIDPARRLDAQLLVMCPTLAALDFLFVMLYAAGANGMLGFLRQRPRLLNRLSGSVLMSAAAFLGLVSKGI